MDDNPKVALYVCYDLMGLDILNGIVPRMRRLGVTPLIVDTKDKRNRQFKVPTPPIVSFFNAGILRDAVIPYLESQPIVPAKNQTYRQIVDIYKCDYLEQDDINDPGFVADLAKDKRIIGHVSERFLQVFSSETIDVLKQSGFFLNLHSGKLPQWGGLLTPFRTAEAGEKEFGLTLHEMAVGLDRGNIVEIRERPLDPTVPVLETYLASAEDGVSMLEAAFARSLETGHLIGTPQDLTKAGYYTNPTAEQFATYQAQGMSFANPFKMPRILVDRFSVTGTAHEAGLLEEVISAIRANAHLFTHEMQNAIAAKPFASPKPAFA